MDRLIKLVNLANEANSLVNELDFISIEATSSVFGDRQEIHLGSIKFDEYKDKYGWVAQTKILSDGESYKEFVWVNGVELFCVRPVTAKEAV